MKRSLSPQSVPEGHSQAKKPKFFGLLRTLKHALTGTTEKSDNELSPASNFNEEVFPTDFTSRKRRLSVQESLRSMSLYVPRSSSIVGLPTYQAISNSLQSEKEAITGELEQRRMSVVAPLNDVELLKEQSPTYNVLPKNQILPINPYEMELEPEEEELPIVIEHEFAPLYRDGSGNLVRPPFINLDPRERYNLLQLKKSIEASEFLQNRLKYMVDPDETTLVIKPNNKVESSTQTFTKDFLDKSIHFNALRTKLALASRKQRRSKRGRGMFSGEFYYEPEKEKSAPVSDSKLSGYLGGLSQPVFSNGVVAKLTPKPLPDEDPAETITKRQKLTSQRAGLEESIRSGQPREAVLDDDYLKKTEKISSIIKLKNQPSPEKKLEVGPSSAFNFEINKKDFGSILQKRKEDEDLVQKQPPTPAIAPEKAPVSNQKPLFGEQSTTPKPLFGSSADSARPTKRTRGEDDDGSKEPLFGQKTPQLALSSGKSEAPKPAFSFNVQKTDSKDSGAESGEKPSLFGKPKDPESSSKPLFSFGAKSSTETETAPKPSITPITEVSDLAKSAFSFGSTSAKAEKADTPTFSFTPKADVGAKSSTETTKDAKSQFSFGEKKTDAPQLSFGEKKSDNPPQFSFGEKKSETTPTFSFGEKSSAPAPSLSFGEKKSDATPSFSFGEKKPTTPTSFSFGEKKPESSTSGLFGSSTDAPKFSFGKSNEASTASTEEAKKSDVESKPEEVKEAPKFSFGSSTTEAPKFLFGSKSESVPSFSFQNNSEDKKEKSEPPKFSFGQAPALSTSKSQDSAPTISFGTKETTPGFSFGAKAGDSANKDTSSVFSFTSKESTPKPLFPSAPQTTAKPAFSFGNPAALTNAALAPFSFGNNGGSQQAEPAKPAFSFGQSASADPALIFGGGAPAPAFSFGAATTPSQPTANPQTPFGFGGANNNLAAPSPRPGAFGGPGSGVSTPNQVSGFGQTQPQSNPASVFGAANNAQVPAFSFNAGQGFNSAPGSFGLASRENTPPVVGGTPAFNGQNQGPAQLFTPPLAMNGRKIAQMRQRKRF